MNKDLILKLVRVANSLDNMGLTQEANVVDRIARKHTAQLLPQNNFQEETLGATYTDLIERYKSYIIEGNRNEGAQFLNYVLSGQNRNLNTAQKKYFKFQADRISNENRNLASTRGTIDIMEIQDYMSDFRVHYVLTKRDFDMRWKQMVQKIYKDKGKTPQINQELQESYKLEVVPYINR
jgi:hypothetical protein